MTTDTDERINSKRIAAFEIRHDDAPGGTIEADGIVVAHTVFDAVFFGRGLSPQLAAYAAFEQLAESGMSADKWAHKQIEAEIADLDDDENAVDLSAAILMRFGYPESREEALARHLDIPVDDVSEDYDETSFDAGGLGDYLVLTDSEADEAAEERILDSVWAFNGPWLSDYLPGDLTGDDVDAMRGDRCEDANDMLIALIKAGRGLDEFVADAMAEDGRGHFLAGYDSEEIDIVGPDGETFYVFRTN